jgi:hypothetical protein
VTAWKWKLGSESERRKVSDVKARVRGAQIEVEALSSLSGRKRSMSFLPDQLLTSSGVNASSAVTARPTIALRSVKGIAPTGAGGASTEVFTLQSPHGMMRQGFDLEMEGRHVGVEAGADQVVRVGAGFGAMLGRAVEEA